MAHNRNVVILDRKGFDELYVYERDLCIDSLALNHKSDFIRAYLLQYYGGLYIDADCLVLKDLSPIIDLASQHGFVGYREPLGYMSCNFMASVSGGQIIREHYKRVCVTLRSRQKLAWLDLASTPMEGVVSQFPSNAFLLPTELVMPLSWTETTKLCIARREEEHEREFQAAAYCYMLSNNTIKSRLETKILYYMPEEHLLRSPYFISYLFRKSLGNGVH